MKERFDKLLEIWGRVSLAQKISLVVAVLGIIGLSVGIMNWTAGGTSMRPLVSGADAKDAMCIRLNDARAGTLL